MDNAPRGYGDMTLIRSFPLVDDEGHLYRVEVREDPETKLRVKCKYPMPSDRRRGFRSED